MMIIKGPIHYISPNERKKKLEWNKEIKKEKRQKNRSDGKRNKIKLYTRNQRLALDWMIGRVLRGSSRRRGGMQMSRAWTASINHPVKQRGELRETASPCFLSVCLGLVLRCCSLVTGWQVWRLEGGGQLTHTTDRQQLYSNANT